MIEPHSLERPSPAADGGSPSRAWNDESGFTIVEVMIVLVLFLVVTYICGRYLPMVFQQRARDAARERAIAGNARGLKVLEQDAAATGLAVVGNGIVLPDSGATRLRFRSNLNAYTDEPGASDLTDENEDITFYVTRISQPGDEASGRTIPALARFDAATGEASVVLENVDTFRVRYFGALPAYAETTCDIETQAAECPPAAARHLVATVCTRLPAVGAPSAPGYQPPQAVTSSIVISLHNENLNDF